MDTTPNTTPANAIGINPIAVDGPTAFLTMPPAPVSVPATIPARRRSLFTITLDVMALGDLLDEVDGDVTDEDRAEAVSAWFAEIECALPVKVDSYCALIREFEAKAEARKTEAARLSALAATDANNAKRLKAALLSYFQLTGRTKLETNRFKVAVQANGGKKPLIIKDGVAPENIPAVFCKVSVAVDNDAIRSALEYMEKNPVAEEGQPDAADFEALAEVARLGERGVSLRIK